MGPGPVGTMPSSFLSSPAFFPVLPGESVHCRLAHDRLGLNCPLIAMVVVAALQIGYFLSARSPLLQPDARVLKTEHLEKAFITLTTTAGARHWSFHSLCAPSFRSPRAWPATLP